MRALNTRFEDVQSKIRQSLQCAQAVSITTDLWSSLRMEAYMTVTAHCINADWEMQSVVLETKQMEETHTGDNIAARLCQVADSYQIQQDMRVAVVTDNAANMVLSVDVLKDSGQWPEVQLVRCAGHTLQLCVNSAIKQDPVARTVGAARHLVAHFKKGHKAKTGLKEKQEQQRVPQHELIQDVATRWNSTCYMLERLLEQRWPITAVLSDPNYTKRSDSSTLDMTTEQWNIAQDVTDVLKPIITLTELLSQENNASISATFPMLENLKKCHLVVAHNDSPTKRKIKLKLVEEIDSRWKLHDRLMTTRSVYITAAVMDPRFKSLSFLEDDKRDEAYIAVAELADRLSAAAGAHRGAAGAGQTQDTDEEDLEQAPKKQKTDKEKDIAMLLCGEVADDEELDVQGRSAFDEMKDYLQDRSKGTTSGPLSWWKHNQDRYPRLALAAKRLLCVPATSTPAERIFSKAGFIVNKSRSCLLPKNVDMLIFLAHNLSKVD
ncbi:hypothetical protein WMY93_026951 [Mugilogobius chulae]|uniref:HAT C-terminal dimerisation domain-containing protein n=1 Tax=Mugilogobius chulae TaxID=88201 RepID=A0AAW0MW76_9GOBI